MRRVLVGVAAVALLAGCSAEPTVPPPPTDAEIIEIQHRYAAEWWTEMFPAEEQPDVAVVEWVDGDDQQASVEDCIRESGAPGMTDIGINFEGVSQPQIEQFFRAQWVCLQQYPAVISDTMRAQTLSDAQLSYVYDYIIERLVPCLRMIGFDVATAPPREVFVDASANLYGSLFWNPYMELQPMPNQAEEWPPIVARCPPPPFPEGMLPEGPNH